jgi:hypothetical protein
MALFSPAHAKPPSKPKDNTAQNSAAAAIKRKIFLFMQSFPLFDNF